MGSQDAESAAETCRLATMLRRIEGRSVLQEGEEISSAESTQVVFAAVDGLDQPDFFGIPETEAAKPLSPSLHGRRDRAEESAQGSRRVDGRQGVQVALIAGLGDLGSSGKVGNPGAKDAPRFGSGGISLLGAEHRQAVRVVDRGFHSEDRSLLVMDLHRVAIDRGLYPNALGTILVVAGDLAGKRSLDPFSQVLIS